MSAAQKHTPAEIMERYGIGKDAYYLRLNKGGIKPKKQSGKAYLDDEQLKEFDKIHKQIEMEKNGNIVKADSSEVVQDDYYQIPTEPVEELDSNLDNLIREAAELKAQSLAMPELVKLALADQMSFDDLPEDLKQKVLKVRDAANPKWNATAIASQLLQKHKQQQQKKIS